MIDAQPLTRKVLQKLRSCSSSIVTTELTEALLLVHEVYDAVRAALEHSVTPSGTTVEETEAWMNHHDELCEQARGKRLQLEIILGIS